jgi:hypothetical protein
MIKPSKWSHCGVSSLSKILNWVFKKWGLIIMQQEMQTEPTKHGRLGFITGVVPKVKALSFERILFRATRGNMYLKQAPIDELVIDPATGEKVLPPSICVHLQLFPLMSIFGCFHFTESHENIGLENQHTNIMTIQWRV